MDEAQRAFIPLSERKRHPNHLSVAYPATLEEYAKAVTPESHLSLFPPFAGQHFAISNLARETEALVLLPSALWMSSCEPKHNILHGYADSDGRRYQLNPVDVRRCLAIKLEYYLTYVQKSFTFPSRYCCLRSGEEQCANKALISLGAHFAAIRGARDLPIRWDSFCCWKNDVCAGCEEVAVSRVSKNQKSLWNNLPAQFDLPQWETMVADINSVPPGHSRRTPAQAMQ
ncbi:hypothetical protein BD410DRAFT_615057 [Rickenella mellea]|uniref:Uncharacterized protein n=1 Tax=Rickenella mellea TaxID=50990 RepID=A0A4Y7PNE1_9AGAM|nr:hypothetical protein BD410DRAFT_615057 [Rickenella mellea]